MEYRGRLQACFSAILISSFGTWNKLGIAQNRLFASPTVRQLSTKYLTDSAYSYSCVNSGRFPVRGKDNMRRSSDAQALRFRASLTAKPKLLRHDHHWSTTEGPICTPLSMASPSSAAMPRGAWWRIKLRLYHVVSPDVICICLHLETYAPCSW